MSRSDRKEKRDISNVTGNAAAAYRQRVLAKQADRLVNELSRARADMSSTDGVIKQTVVKKKSTRVSYRVLGVVFALAGAGCMWWAMSGSWRMLKAAVAISAMAYGFYLVKASFRDAAYGATYLFGDDAVTVLQRRGSRTIPYESVTSYTMIEPDPEMKYYIIKFDRGRESYVVPFAGAKSKCEAVYDIFEKKTRCNADEDTDIERETDHEGKNS